MKTLRPHKHGRDHRAGGEDPIPVVLERKVLSDTTTVSVGDGKLIWAITEDLDGCILSDADAFVTTVSSSGLVTVQLRNVTRAVDMLSTKITIDANEFTSYTAATPAVIDDLGSPARSIVFRGNLIAVDVDVAGTGAKGLGVMLVFWRRPINQPPT